MLPLIELGDKLTISKTDEREFEHSYLSQVGDILGDDLILAHMPLYHDNLVQLPLGDGYTLLFHTKDELIEARGMILEYISQNGTDFIKVQYRDCHPLQRRRFFRQSCYLNFTFIRIPKSDEEVFAEEEISVFRGIIKNISGGGIGFISNAKLSVGDQMSCHILLNNIALNIKGCVRDIVLPEYPGDKYTYRVEFVDIDRPTQEQVIQYVYYLQLEMIKRLHGN